MTQTLFGDVNAGFRDIIIIRMLRPITPPASIAAELLILPGCDKRLKKNVSLDEANAAFADVNDDLLYIRIVADVSKTQEFGITMLKGGRWDETKITYDVANETVHGMTENKGEGAKAKAVSGALPNEDGTITMKIYIDRSLVEAYFNDYKAISIRAYPEQKDSKAIELFAAGEVKIIELYVASMSSIFD